MPNSFYVAPPNILEALQQYDQSYKTASDDYRQSQNDAILREVGQQVANGGINDSALGKLFSMRGSAGVPSLNAAAHLLAAKQQGQGVYGNVIYGVLPDGTVAIGSHDKQGRFVPINTGNFSPALPTKTIDTGTGTQVVPGKMPFGPAPASGAPGGPPVAGGYNVPKDVAGSSEARERGKDIANAQDAYIRMQSKMPGVQIVVRQLNDLADKATYTTAGNILDTVRREFNMEPRASSVARASYISMVDNQVLPLLRETFGAQFTQREGETLRNTLGDPTKSPKEKKAVLDSFIQQKVRDVEALKVQADQTARAQPQPAQGTQGPPIPGARQAPNGKWYIKGGGKWYEVTQ